MTQLESYEKFVVSRGCHLSLSEILRTEFSAEYRKLNVYLRDRLGWKYSVKINRKAGDNFYTFVPPIVFKLDGRQRCFS